MYALAAFSLAAVVFIIFLLVRLRRSGVIIRELKRENRAQTIREKETLAEIDHYYHALLEQIPAGVIVAGRGGKITYANTTAERMLAAGSRSVKKTPLVKFASNFELSKKIDEALAGKESEREIVINRPKETILRALMSPIKEDGEVQGAVVILEDVTKLRRLEATRQELISGFSHELRTPIASCQAALEALTEWGADRDPAERKRFLDNLNLQVDHLSRLIAEMLQLTRLESGASILEKRVVKATDLIADTVTAVGMQAEAKSVRLESSSADGLAVKVDPQLFLQALINLADNAVKYTDKGGLVLLEAREEGRQALFRVTDTGSGIPKEAIPHIFQRFYRVDKHRSRAAGGTGLGLALTKHIVEAHRGRLSVESALHDGSSFTITVRKL